MLKYVNAKNIQLELTFPIETGITPDFPLFKQFLSKGRLRNLQFKGKEV
jgi:hypothetical protein